jgi:hypothetical protein
MADLQIRIGQLRWPVMLARRRQLFNTEPGSVGQREDWIDVEVVRCDIQSIAPMTFYGAVQVDRPAPSHRIFMRWVGFLDQSNAILRDTRLPDGSSRTEVFRVRRVREVNGRKRFTELECDLEKTTLPPAGTAQPLFNPPLLEGWTR